MSSNYTLNPAIIIALSISGFAIVYIVAWYIMKIRKLNRQRSEGFGNEQTDSYTNGLENNSKSIESKDPLPLYNTRQNSAQAQAYMATNELNTTQIQPPSPIHEVRFNNPNRNYGGRYRGSNMIVYKALNPFSSI